MAARSVLVLGASGFVGRRIVARLLRERAWRVIAASRRPAHSADPALVPLPLDTRNRAALDAALTGVDAVVNCVAGDAPTIRDGAHALFAAAAAAATPPRIVHFSSLAAYGTAEGTVDESSPLLGDLNDYAAAKAASETIAAAYPARVILRPGIIYGPHSDWWSRRIARLLRQRRLGDLGVAGDGLCNLVHVEDVAAATLAALETPGIEGQAFNLGAHDVPTWNEYFTRYARALDATPVRAITPRRLAIELHAVAPLLKVLEWSSRLPLLGRIDAPPIRPWLLELCRQRIAMSVVRAERSLNMQWTPLDFGLERTAEWYRGEFEK